MNSMFIKIIQFILSYIILAFSFWSGYVGKLDVMVISFLAFILIVFVNNMDKISEIKATAKGIEAKTREVVAKAEVTIEELQNMAKILAKTELSLIIRSGRLGSFNAEERERVKDSILSILENLKVSKEEQDRILDTDWNKFIVFDYAHAILGRGHIPQGFSPEEIKQWEKLREGGVENPPSPNQIKEFLIEVGCLTEEREELIKDYEYFIKNKKHRRPEIWKDYLDWGPLKKN